MGDMDKTACPATLTFKVRRTVGLSRDNEIIGEQLSRLLQCIQSGHEYNTWQSNGHI